MTNEEILNILNAHEWNDVEFKEAKTAVPKNAYETVSAFANTAGGHLVFGVKKEGKNFEVVGVLNVDKVQNDFITALRQKEKISLIINIKEELCTIDGYDLLIFYIPEVQRKDKPVYLNGDIRRSFIRKGAADIKCSHDELQRLMRDADMNRYDSEPLPKLSVNKVFDNETVSWYRTQFERRNPEHEKSQSNIDFLFEWNFILEEDEKLIPTRAGILLFGKDVYVRQILPRPVLDYQRIDTKLENWSPEKRWHDRQIYEENIFKTWRELVGKYMRIADHPFSLDPATMRRNDDPPDYVSFRESAINLLIHQDYGDHTRKPVIKFFLDQTLFWNPGDAFNTESELLEPTEKEVRNPAIVKAFRRIGLSDQAGTGIRAIFKNWRDLGNVPPVIGNDKSRKSFEIILLKKVLITDNQKRFQKSVGVSLTKEEAEVFAYAVENKIISIQNIRSILVCTASNARKIAEHLIVQTLLQQNSDNLYELAPVMKERFNKNQTEQVITPIIEQVEAQVKTLIEALKKGDKAVSVINELNLNNRQVKAVKFIIQNKKITTAEYMDLNDTSNRTALRDIKNLIEIGVLDRKGNKKNAFYILSDTINGG